MAESSNGESTAMDWQLNRSLAECTTQLYMNQHMSDVTFVLTSVQPPRRVPAHRFLLAIRSPVFEAMYFGPLQEVAKEVTLSDVPVDGFLSLLRFLYTDIAEINGNIAMECLQVGHMYRVPSFVEHCEDILKKSIDTDNVLCILEAASIFNLKQLQDQCLVYITINTPSVFKCEAFPSISKDTLKMVVGESCLQASELDIYVAVNQWTEKKCELEGVPKSHENKRKFLGDVFSNLRIGHINPEDFARVVATQNLLSEKEIIMVFRLHMDKTVSHLDFVENAKRDGHDAHSIPLKLENPSLQTQTDFLETYFKFNHGVNFVGINILDKTAANPQNSRPIQLFSVLLLEVNPGSKTQSSKNNNAFLLTSTLYRLERDKDLCSSGTNFDILFDSPFLLMPGRTYILCIAKVHCNSENSHLYAGLRSWKVFDKNKLVAMDNGQKYVRHQCHSNPHLSLYLVDEQRALIQAQNSYITQITQWHQSYFGSNIHIRFGPPPKQLQEIERMFAINALLTV